MRLPARTRPGIPKVVHEHCIADAGCRQRHAQPSGLPAHGDGDRIGPVHVDSQPKCNIFKARGIERGGAAVVVRPDQYVVNVMPLSATKELADFFRPILRVRSQLPGLFGSKGNLL